MNYKIKHVEDEALITQIDEYLDDTFMLFSSYGINTRIFNGGNVQQNAYLICLPKSALISSNPAIPFSIRVRPVYL